jgi:hypothetical protein
MNAFLIGIFIGFLLFPCVTFAIRAAHNHSNQEKKQ